MKSMQVLIATVLMLATASALAATPAEEACRTRAQEIISAMQKNDFAAATAHFDARMRAGLDAAKLAQVWQKILPAQAGAFVHAADTDVSLEIGGIRALIPLQFANAWLNMRVACDADGSVGGLFFVPGAAPTQTPVAHSEKPVAVKSPLGPLPGTLELPAGKGPFPAVLLVAGSGPSDRDETLGPNKPFADVALGLAAAGIASLRYDKRTHVYGAQMAGTAIGIDDEVTDDAVAALHLLATEPDIDHTHIFVLGHSLGAFMAPRIAKRDPKVTGLILLAAPATFDLDVVLRQTQYLERVQHATQQQTDDAVAPIIDARNSIAMADPAHPPAGEFFHAPASYWLSLRSYDAITTAQSLPQPILILQGDGDYQVTPADDFAKWQKAFAHSERVTLKHYAGLSHLFMPAGNPPSPADYANAGHVDAHVIDDIAQWIANQAKGKAH